MNKTGKATGVSVSVFGKSLLAVALFLLIGCVSCENRQRIAKAPVDESPGYEIASYYFPNYHPDDARNMKWKGHEWSEWELVKNAKPRFPGHHQPNVPLWGYTDESDPKDMAQKIAAAADNGIDAFIFDWYWYEDGLFLEQGVEQGFMKAPNNNRLKFCLMWADHDWQNIHPYKRGAKREILYDGKISPQSFDRMCDYIIEKYFKHHSYWKIENKPYFSIYDLTTLMEGFGSVEETRKGLDKFRQKTKAAGFDGLHINAVVWGRAILPGEKVPTDPVKLVKDLGFDSVTSYVWVHHVGMPELQTDYTYVQNKYFEYWDKARTMFGLPYYPNVTMGWDPSPRTVQEDEYGNFGYPFTNTITNNTPENFEAALRATKERLDKFGDPKIFNINCWNEWTEGSYLEPDVRHGMKYLEAIKTVFGPSKCKAK